MTYERFLSELSKAGLTVAGFAELIGMNRNSVSNYASQRSVPKHLAVIATLLAEMNVRDVPFREVIARIAMVPKKPRGAARRGRFGGSPQQQLELDS